MISNTGVLRRVLGAETDETETDGEDDGAERPAPKLRSKLGLFLALVVLTALGEATVRGIRKQRRKRAA
ncbi:hypothetical protein [Natranaeroarchaeum sulfidigenes]|uniref:Uncharacterized protein n=1 Tax=Natranaeroarchaeum sulfidigenes TaxID=2784880 RepID=A0A897MP55_9EURY|nr:hypothetical protein [Natranaeroarchaeum sulfidigenes]QSG02121.1 hypothetical protein AArcS_0899 [Natranaeroarchaeum sulfidigenes]